MDVGMLWFDNDKERDLSTKVMRAADYYRKKYGNVPNLCYVHPNMFPPNARSDAQKEVESKKVMAGNVEVRPAITVLPHHFWIGVNGMN